MKVRTTRPVRRGGFTLLEVLLVLAILGVIAAIVVPNLLGRQREGYAKATQSSIYALENALKLYAQNHDGEFPQGGQEEMLAAMLQPKDRDGNAERPYLDKPPTDAWGQNLYYRYPATKQTIADKPDIWSAGPDKQSEDGSGDDINNWTTTGSK